MLVISNTTPLSCFARIGRADLLHSLYGEVHIPTAVVEELSRARDRLKEVHLLPWLRVHDVSDSVLLPQLMVELDPGEAEAIALATSQHSDCLLLIDDQAGRRMALSLRLKLSGSLGVLLAAKRRGLLLTIKTTLIELRDQGGLWLDERIYRSVLSAAGE